MKGRLSDLNQLVALVEFVSVSTNISGVGIWRRETASYLRPGVASISCTFLYFSVGVFLPDESRLHL